MRAPIKLLFYITIIFTVAMSGLEVFRIMKIHMDIEERIEIDLENAIELSLDENYRKDHISLMQRDLCEDTFYMLFKNDFKLDNSLSPIGPSYFSSPFTISRFTLEPGAFNIVGETPTQTINPSGYIEGEVQIKPLVFNFIGNITLEFKVFAENQRID